MALLPGFAIRKLISDPDDEDSRLVITPLLDAEEQIKLGGASVDLRLGSKFTAAKRGNLAYSDPVRLDESTEPMEAHYVPLGRYFVLHPRHFVLGTVLEYVRLPRTYGAYVLGRSTWGRRGLVIATAVGVHPGYAGNIALELTNLGEIPLKLYPGSTICQLFLHSLPDGMIAPPDASQFVGATDPVPGKLTEDKVMARIRKLAGSPVQSDLS
jgi:dCTP deaminase